MLKRTSQKKCLLFSSYNFLKLILSGQLLIFITFHSCFLSIIHARASYLMTQLLRQLHIHISAYTSVPTFKHPCFIFSSPSVTSCVPGQCAYASSEKNTPCRNFFRIFIINFKKIVIFLREHVVRCIISRTLTHLQYIH